MRGEPGDSPGKRRVGAQRGGLFDGQQLRLLGQLLPNREIAEGFVGGVGHHQREAALATLAAGRLFHPAAKLIAVRVFNCHHGGRQFLGSAALKQTWSSSGSDSSLPTRP